MATIVTIGISILIGLGALLAFGMVVGLVVVAVAFAKNMRWP